MGAQGTSVGGGGNRKELGKRRRENGGEELWRDDHSKTKRSIRWGGKELGGRFTKEGSKKKRKWGFKTKEKRVYWWQIGGASRSRGMGVGGGKKKIGGDDSDKTRKRRRTGEAAL